MIPALNKNLFVVKEHIGLFSAACDYDILDPGTGDIIMRCREEKLGRITKFFRFADSLKRTTPFDIQARTPEGAPVVRVMRGIPIYVSRVSVLDEDDNPIGGFSQRLFSIGGAFDVVDANGLPVCRLQGGLTGRNFRFLGPENIELARVTRKWAGLGKELFTSANDYMLEIDDAVPEDSTVRQLIFASVLCIGMVLKIEIP